MPNCDVAAETVKNVYLGNVTAMAISNPSTYDLKVHIDYQASTGTWSSAVKGSAGYSIPFTLQAGQSKAVAKSDLESEYVRVCVQGDGGHVHVVY